jgi:hypothetical protein
MKIYKIHVMASPASIYGNETWIVRKTRIETAQMELLGVTGN